MLQECFKHSFNLQICLCGIGCPITCSLWLSFNSWAEMVSEILINPDCPVHVWELSNQEEKNNMMQPRWPVTGMNGELCISNIQSNSCGNQTHKMKCVLGKLASQNLVSGPQNLGEWPDSSLVSRLSESLMAKQHHMRQKHKVYARRYPKGLMSVKAFIRHRRAYTKTHHSSSRQLWASGSTWKVLQLGALLPSPKEYSSRARVSWQTGLSPAKHLSTSLILTRVVPLRSQGLTAQVLKEKPTLLSWALSGPQCVQNQSHWQKVQPQGSGQICQVSHLLWVAPSAQH